jgi:hypothetical protein
MFLLTLDPGGTTGWALSYYDDNTPLAVLDGGQIPNGVVGVCEFFTLELGSKLRALDIQFSDLEIVAESFRVRFVYADVTPLRIEGALTALLGPDRVQYQTPGTKALVGDQRLRELGLWIKGHRHQNDAIIHALAHMLVIKHKPTLEAYYEGD